MPSWFACGDLQIDALVGSFPQLLPRTCGLLTLDIAFVRSIFTRVYNMPDDVGITPLRKLALQYFGLRPRTLSHIQLDFVQYVFAFPLPSNPPSNSLGDIQLFDLRLHRARGTASPRNECAAVLRGRKSRRNLRRTVSVSSACQPFARICRR
jgi:hypothetical protein